MKYNIWKSDESWALCRADDEFSNTYPVEHETNARLIYSFEADSFEEASGIYKTIRKDWWMRN